MVLELQSRGLGLDLRSCVVVPVVKEPIKVTTKDSCSLRRSFAPFPSLPSFPQALCREWPASPPPRSGVQPIFFSLSFSLRLEIPASHFLSVDTDAPKPRTTVSAAWHGLPQMLQIPKQLIAFSGLLYWHFSLSQTRTGHICWLQCLRLFFSLAFSSSCLPVCKDFPKNNRFPLLQQKNGVRENPKIPQKNTEQYPFYV